MLVDENQFTSNSLQELTYRLSYIYGRATKSVSLVPPVYYAHLLAARARLHRRGDDWSDSAATSDTQDATQQLASYAPVHSKLKSGK